MPAMPEMPSMPAMPEMPSTDEPMAGRKALEQINKRQESTASSGAKHPLNKAGKVNENTPLSSAADTVPAPSASSPISSFGALLSDYADIDALLQRLQAQREGATVGTRASETAPLQNAPADARGMAQSAASILRFVINGSDVRASCRNVHFSQTEEDGSFLLTAERRYWSGNAPKIESFYLLFTAQGGSAAHYYDVTLSVVSEEENSVSYLSRLSGIEGLTAAKTGNLVTLRAKDEGITADLLLDIGQ